MKKISLLLFLLLSFVVPVLYAGTCTVDAATTNQYIRSIGASSAWSSIGSLGTALFADDNVNGHIGISSLRARIDPNGSHANEVNQLVTAKGVNPNLLCWSTEWSPPAQYKANNNVNGGASNDTFLGAESGTPNSADTGYASYLVSYIQYAASRGINLYAVSIQNEPNWNPTYEACLWTAGQFEVFTRAFHSALQSAGLSTKIMLPEPVNPGGMNLASTTMNNATSASYVSILGTHLYGGMPNPLSSYGFSQVTNQEFWETEMSGNTNDMPGALQEAGWIQSCLVGASMNSFHYWWLVDLIVNNSLDVKAYVLGNYSKFIRPGYYRMAATAAPTSGLLVSAFKDTNTSSPTKFVIVAINNNTSATSQTFNLNSLGATSVTPWLTNSGTNLVAQAAVSVSGNSFTYSLPAQSVVSFVGANNGGITATNTPVVPTKTPTKTNTPIPPTNTFTKTNTPVPPTNTFTKTYTPTNTFTKTNTLVPPTNTFTKTNTPIPPTATPTTPAPTNTSTSSVQPTNTSTLIVPTATPTTPTPTNTSTSLLQPTNTSTLIVPTATPTTPAPTNTSTSSVQPTNTSTLIVPTATPTTPVPTNTSTNSVQPTNTSTPIVPTATPTTPVPTNTQIPTFTPTITPGSGALTVYLLSSVTTNSTNSPHPQIEVKNTGTGALNLNNVEVRYWINCDCTGQSVQAWVDWAGLLPAGTSVTGNIQTAFVPTSLGGQTNYISYRFTGNMVLQPGQMIQIQSRFNLSDWSNMLQSNDWSFAAYTAFTAWSKITGYISGGLVWGSEPSSTSSQTAQVNNVMTYPNPATSSSGATLKYSVSSSSVGSASMGTSDAVSIPVSGKVRISIYTVSERLIWQKTLDDPSFISIGEHAVHWDGKTAGGQNLAAGTYILKVSLLSNSGASNGYSTIIMLK